MIVEDALAEGLADGGRGWSGGRYEGGGDRCDPGSPQSLRRGSGDHAEGAREAIGGLAFPGEASDGGDQDDEGDVLFVVESDLNPLGIGAGLMTLGSMANRADSTAHGEVGELAVDALQFFFQLVGREVVETGFLPPRGSHEQEC